jgi:hypothetical protein
MTDFFSDIKIIVANYGGKDVTSLAKQQLKLHKHFTANNASFGDPLPGNPKFLHVIYSFHGVLVCSKRNLNLHFIIL